MDKFEKVLKEHLDNDLKTVSKKYRKILNNKQYDTLNELVKIHFSAKSIRVDDKAGKRVLRNALNELSRQDSSVETKARRFPMFDFRYAFVAIAALAIFSVAWLNFGSKTSQVSNLKPESNQALADITNQSVSDVSSEDAILASSDGNSKVNDQAFDLASKAEVTNEDF